MSGLKEKYRQFCQWQKEPHRVAPLSEEQRVCTTCGTHYIGNYCPRCGQYAKIGRYSFRNAVLLYLDVWGLGNRGMFRSIRDLILRPGYMIRDYLKGMQMAYFPPFKMFFLIFALSFVIDTGLNIRGIDRQKLQEEKTENILARFTAHEEESPTAEETLQVETDPEANPDRATRAKMELDRISKPFEEWLNKHTSAILLIALLFFSLPLWFMFRHCPAIPDFRLSECFVAMVYIINMLSIYAIVPSLFCFSFTAEIIFDSLTLIPMLVAIRQLTGYSIGGTTWRVLLAFIPVTVMTGLLYLIAAAGVVLYAIITTA